MRRKEDKLTSYVLGYGMDEKDLGRRIMEVCKMNLDYMGKIEGDEQIHLFCSPQCACKFAIKKQSCFETHGYRFGSMRSWKGFESKQEKERCFNCEKEMGLESSQTEVVRKERNETEGEKLK